MFTGVLARRAIGKTNVYTTSYSSAVTVRFSAAEGSAGDERKKNVLDLQERTLAPILML